jgi:rhamnulokinase
MFLKGIKNSMLRHQRHLAILKELEKNESLSIEELREMIHTSESTLRRDIDYLADTQKVRKIRGGIARTQDETKDISRLVTSPFSSEKMKNAKAKAAIGRAAAELLSGNESIIINGGTTTYHIAPHLPESGLTILTNSLPIVDHISRQTGNRCFVAGGEVFHHHMIILGHLQSELPNFFGNIFFTGCQGISPWGIMEGDPLLVHAEQRFISQSDKLIVLADSSKFTTRESIIMCPLKKVHAVVTDDKIDHESRSMLEKNGVRVIIAGEPSKQARRKTAVRCLSLDCGASNCRLVGLTIENERLTMEEFIRMDNGPEKSGRHLVWPHQRLLSQTIKGLTKVAERQESYQSIGVDAWGVDYVLLDESHQLLDRPVAYRDPRTDDLITRFTRKELSKEKIYAKTGIQFLSFNTLYQLYAQTLNEPELLAKTHRLLFTADYFHFLLSGSISIEQTMASTSQMWNLKRKCWDQDLLERLALPKEALQMPVTPGTEVGILLPEIRQKTGLSPLRVIAPASHDTASAVLAVPAVGEDWAYLSSGTWSLLGIESKEPITGPDALKANWTNEGGYGGTIRFLKNITGLWIIQEIARMYKPRQTFAELAIQAQAAPAFRSLINPDAPRFFSPSNMIQEIRRFCRETGQPVPQTAGELVRCAYDSLSLLYRKALGDLCAISGRNIKALHVVGGGSQADILNQLTASAIGIPVMAGPVEATALGNGLAQFLATGAIDSVTEARQLLAHSFVPKRFDPELVPGLDAAYQRFLALHATSSEQDQS